MLKDRILAGTIAGMIATLIKDIPNLILWKLGVVEYTYFHLGSAALVSPQNAGTSIGLVIGIVVDIITGGTLGLLVIYLFNFTGRDYWWYKGLVIGNVIWLFGLGLAINFGVSRIVPNEPIFRLISLVEHQIFGLVGAYLIIRWYPETKKGLNKHEKRLIRPLRGQLLPTPARKNEQKERTVRIIKPKQL